jgi:arabinofuranosyltransferase
MVNANEDVGSCPGVSERYAEDLPDAPERGVNGWPLPNGESGRHSQRAVWALGAALIVGYASLRVAWISDDSLINVRTSLNLSHGNGAVFNVGERVQAYTSPLWFGLQFIVGWLTSEHILSAVLLGTVLTGIATAVLVAAATSTVARVAVVAVMLSSTTLMDYSTSGLENALAAAVLVALFTGAQRAHSVRRHALVAGLLGTTLLVRHDLVLLIAPVAIVLMWRVRGYGRRTAVGLAVPAVAPLLLWSLIAWWYYGRLLPNTFAAKTNVDIPRAELLNSGARWLAVSLEADPILVVVWAAAGAVGFVWGSSIQRCAVIGAAMYVVYVVWIGGDFMAGRFLSAPTIVALWVLATTAVPPIRQRAVLGAVGVVALIAAGPALLERPSYDSPQRWMYHERGGIADEGGFYRERGWSVYALVLENSYGPDDLIPSLWRLRRLEDSWRHEEPLPTGVERPALVRCGFLGAFGIVGGPQTHVIDSCGLADPVIAQLPFQPSEPFKWRVGHYEREVPAGYLDAIRYADSERVVDPEIRELVERTWKRVRG